MQNVFFIVNIKLIIETNSNGNKFNIFFNFGNLKNQLFWPVSSFFRWKGMELKGPLANKSTSKEKYGQDKFKNCQIKIQKEEMLLL